MKIERAILVAFLGNYLINNVVAAIVALIPQGASTSLITPQYIVFVLLAAALVAGLAWWYFKGSAMSGWKHGLIFGVEGFLVAIVTAFISGISGVILQTGSLSQAFSVLPNFWPFLWNWSTLVLLAYWTIPAAAYGWWIGRGKGASAIPAGTPKPIF